MKGRLQFDFRSVTDDAAPVSKKSRRNCIDKSDRSVRHHSVGHRLVEKVRCVIAVSNL